MPTEFQAQTSFIPKQPLTEDRFEGSRNSSSGGPASFLTFIAVLIVVVSILSAGILGIYQKKVLGDIATIKRTLAREAEAFKGSFLDELRLLDRRIISAQAVLGSHISVTPLFEVISQSTLKSIQFTKFAYTVNSQTNGQTGIEVKMSGKAQSYAAIALESDALTTNKYIRDPVFSNLTLDEQSNVLFDLSFTVDSHLVLFGDALARFQAAQTAAQAATQTNAGQNIPVNPTQPAGQTGVNTFPPQGQTATTGSATNPPKK